MNNLSNYSIKIFIFHNSFPKEVEDIRENGLLIIIYLRLLYEYITKTVINKIKDSVFLMNYLHNLKVYISFFGIFLINYILHFYFYHTINIQIIKNHA